MRVYVCMLLVLASCASEPVNSGNLSRETDHDLCPNNSEHTDANESNEMDTLLWSKGGICYGSKFSSAEQVIVVFSDPTCPYSRGFDRRVRDYLSQNPNTLIVSRELPLASSKAPTVARGILVAEGFGSAYPFWRSLKGNDYDVPLEDLISAGEKQGIAREEFLELYHSPELQSQAEQRYPTTSFSMRMVAAIYYVEPELRGTLREEIYRSDGESIDDLINRLSDQFEVNFGELMSQSPDVEDGPVRSNLDLAHQFKVSATPTYYVLDRESWVWSKNPW